MNGVKVTLNKLAVKSRIHDLTEKGTFIISNEFLKDANYYCREDSGELERSAIRASQPEKGLLIWDTPYAKRTYYIGHPAKDKNPNASLMWAEIAATQNRDKYRRMLQKLIDQGV